MDFSGLIASYRPPSAIEEDVSDSLQSQNLIYLRPKQPLRQAADMIIRRKSIESFRCFFEEENMILCVDESVRKGLRLIHYAVYQNEEAVLDLLLECGANPNVMDDVGYTPVHICAEKGYNHLIDILMAYGARIRFTELHPGDEKYGEPPRATAADEPLRLAIRNCEHETARMLLEHGANPNALYYLGYEINMVDPLDLISVELLLLYGADPNARDMQGLTPLMKTCRNSQAVETAHLLISYGADVNAVTDEDQKSPLHYAVLTGNLEIAEVLVFNGAQVCFPMERTRPPPLYYAVLRGNVDMLELLIRSGADVNAISTVVGSALHLSLIERIPNQVEIVETLLRNGANPNAITTTMEDKPVLKPPIGEYILSCDQPRMDIIHLLLRYGARIVLQGQRDHNLGIIKVIYRIHLGLYPEVLNILLEASESFSISFIEQSRQMSEEHKYLLFNKALQPFTLLQAARIQVRRSLGWGPDFLATVQSLHLPKCLKHYVLFDEQSL